MNKGIKPKKDNDDSLITPTSLRLSLSAPRAPPHGTLHRALLNAIHKTGYKLKINSNNSIADQAAQSLIETKSTLLRLVPDLHLRDFHLPHPHLPDSLTSAEILTRTIGLHLLSLERQHSWRDGGTFRSISDTLVTLSAPTLALTEPRAVLNFLWLTQLLNKYIYGSHPMQQLHYYETPTTTRGLVVFIHGGAWGSGKPWMYRLAALPFIKMGYAVAILGYRTYPDANCKQQTTDIALALTTLKKQQPKWFQSNYHRILVGHSSGAHIALLLLVQELPESPTFHAFVGLSGPYDISHHFDFEAARGVEELSPMKPVCGYTRENFALFSPALQLKNILRCKTREPQVALALPPHILLLHGIEDSTVPFTATSEAAAILRSCGIRQCQEIYLSKVGHQETVVHLMLGGKTCDALVEWLQGKQFPGSTLIQMSRL